MKYRIQITGSREFSDYEQIKDAILYSVQEAPENATIVIVSGHAKGADSLAERVAEAYGFEAELHPAMWGIHYLPGSELPAGATLHCPANHEGLGLCKLAGLRRNQEMMALKPNVVLAFKKRSALNKGTQHAMDTARRLGLKVWEYWEES